MVKYHDEKQHEITGPQPTAVVEKGKVSGESLNANTIEKLYPNIISRR